MSETIVCRKASDFLLEGFERGFYCEQCGLEVQVGPEGKAKLKAGAGILCNACMLQIIATGKGKITSLSEIAKRQLRSEPQGGRN